MSEMSVTARALRRRLTIFVAVRGLYALLTTGSEVVRSQKFSPHRRRPSRRRATAKLNHLENRHGHYLYLQTQFGEDRCTQFRVIMVTDPHTHTDTQTHRHDRLQYTSAQLACRIIIVWVAVWLFFLSLVTQTLWLVGCLVFNGTFGTNGPYSGTSAQEINPITYLLQTETESVPGCEPQFFHCPINYCNHLSAEADSHSRLWLQTYQFFLLHIHLRLTVIF